MDDLTTRLLAAIDERERWAKAASTGYGRWTSGPDSSFGGYVVGTREWAHTRTQKSEQALHIQKNDPASVLRRCAADRKIVELYRKHDADMPSWGEEDFPGGVRAGLWEAMVLLAEGYDIEEADHG